FERAPVSRGSLHRDEARSFPYRARLGTVNPPLERHQRSFLRMDQKWDWTARLTLRKGRCCRRKISVPESEYSSARDLGNVHFQHQKVQQRLAQRHYSKSPKDVRKLGYRAFP